MKCVIRGARGKRGYKGEDGERGERGERGKKGDKGEIGNRGIQGPQGVKGEDGKQGIPGQDGKQGIKGDDGPSHTIIPFASAGIGSLYSAFTLGFGTPGAALGAPVNGVTSYYMRLPTGGTLQNFRGYIQLSNTAMEGSVFTFTIFTALSTGDSGVGASPIPSFTNSGLTFDLTTQQGNFFWANSDLVNTKAVSSGDYIALSVTVGTTILDIQFSLGASIELI